MADNPSPKDFPHSLVQHVAWQLYMTLTSVEIFPYLTKLSDSLRYSADPDAHIVPRDAAEWERVEFSWNLGGYVPGVHRDYSRVSGSEFRRLPPVHVE